MKQGVSLSVPMGAFGPAEVGPISYRRLLRWSLIVISGSPYLFVASVAVSAAPMALTSYSSWLLALIINALIGAAAPDPMLLAYYAAATILAMLAQYYGRILTIRSNSAMLAVLQQRLHDRLLRMPTAFHSTHDLGETTTIVLQDAAGCQPMLSELIAAPVTQGIALFSALYFLIASFHTMLGVPLSIQLVLVAILFAVPAVGWRLATRSRRSFDAMRSAQSILATEFTNSAAAPLEVRLLGAEQQRSRAFARALASVTRFRSRAAIQSETANQFQLAAPSFVQLGFLSYAVLIAARAGGNGAGALLPIYNLVPKAIEPIDQIARFLGGLQMIWVQAARLGAVLETSPPQSTLAAPSISTAPEIAFDQAQFSYPGAPIATLHELTHVFPAGRVSAIVGRAGSGKSSLLSVISGLRALDHGTVTIAGHSVANFGDAELRATVAVVSQSPLFIADTIRANFQLAYADASDAEIERVARTVGLWPALVKMGDVQPLDHPMRQGQGLSGGERRLLAVARILLLKPLVLLLDEPTTGLDDVSKHALLDALRIACAGKTVVMVEHDMEFVRSLADQVCCLHEGRFSDIGTPAELSTRPSLFRELLDARQRLVSTTELELHSMPMPSLTGETAQDPWADQAPDGKGLEKQMLLPASTFSERS